jgi:hypothetical protein
MSDVIQTAYREVQTAIYALLMAEGSSISCSVYDEVPKGATFPYVVIADFYDAPFEARNVRGRSVGLEFHIFSRNAGGKFETYDIMDEICDKLTAGKLTISGWSEIWKTMENTYVEQLKEEPGISWMGHLPFTIVVVKS